MPSDYSDHASPILAPSYRALAVGRCLQDCSAACRKSEACNHAFLTSIDHELTLRLSGHKRNPTPVSKDGSAVVP